MPPEEGWNIDRMTGLQKAAILMLALDQDVASTMMQSLGPTMVEDVTRELIVMETIPTDIRDEVVDEFYQMAVERRWQVEGGRRFAKDLLLRSMDRNEAEALFDNVSSTTQRSPFNFLQKAETEHLMGFIQGEHPQTIALILSHLPASKSAEILLGLGDEKQIQVVRRVALMERTNPEVIREVEKGLESRLAAVLSQRFEKAGGVDTVAELLNLVDRTTEKNIFEGIEEDDPDLVEEIRRRMFVFEDIIKVDIRGIQKMLQEVDNEELGIALKGSSDELTEKIFSSMSSRAADMIKEDMQYMGPLRLSDVEAAQQRIVDVVRRLEESGEIIVSGRGGEKDVIV